MILSDGSSSAEKPRPNRKLITKTNCLTFELPKFPLIHRRGRLMMMSRDESVLLEDVAGEKPQLNDAQLAPKLAKGNSK